MRKVSPLKEQMLWGARAEMYKEKYGRNIATDSEGESSESAETAKLFKNLKIPKRGSLTQLKPELDTTYHSPLEKLANADKPTSHAELFDAIMSGFKLVNNNVTATRTALQTQVDVVSSGVRTNTRAIIKTRKDLLMVTDKVLALERKQLSNSILVYDHGMGVEQLKSWERREETIKMLLREALQIGPDLDYLFKIIRTEARIPRVRTAGAKPPPIKVFFPYTSALEYLTTVIQYPTRLRNWHRDVDGKRGSLPRFSIKPNTTFMDRQRTQYARKVIENIKRKGIPEGVRFEATLYGGIRKMENGQSRTAPFERMLTIYANFLPLEDREEGEDQGDQEMALGTATVDAEDQDFHDAELVPSSPNSGLPPSAEGHD